MTRPLPAGAAVQGAPARSRRSSWPGPPASRSTSTAARSTRTAPGGTSRCCFARADDIPAWTADGAVEAAVAGRDQIVESGADVDELVPLGFGRCALEVAVPAAGASLPSRSSTAGGSRPPTRGTAAAFFAAEGLAVETVPIHGSVELAPRLDAADGIVDLVSSGDTLRQNGLRPIATVLESQAALVARRGLDGRARAVADELATVIESVVAARGKPLPDAERARRFARRRDLAAARAWTRPPSCRWRAAACTPSTRWSSADTVVDLLAPLRAAGARSLLVLPIQNLIP